MDLRVAVDAVGSWVANAADRVRILSPGPVSKSSLTAVAITAAVGAAVTAGIAYSVFFTDKAPKKDATFILQQPKRTLLSDISLYCRVYSIRYLGLVINTTLLPKARPSIAFHVPRTSVSKRGNSKPIRCIAYYPSDRLPPSNTPVYINLHGGGFIAGQCEDDDEFCRFLCREAHVICLSPEYSLAPEAPGPAAVDDIAEVVNWARSTFETEHVAVGGFSAGACLALAACAHEAVKGKLDAVTAFYPPVDLSEASDNDFAVKDPYLKAVYYEAQLRNSPPQDLKNPLISPAYVASSDFPQTTIIIAAGMEPNKRDIQKLADRLQQRHDEEHAANPSSSITTPESGGYTAQPRRPFTLIHKLFGPDIPHGWTHIPEFVLRKLGKATSLGGDGDGVECKWEAYRIVAEGLRQAWQQ